MIPCHNICGSRERISFIQHGICGGNGKIADRVRVYHVDKVNQADNMPMPCVSLTDQDIVIIRIAMNDTHRQCG